MDEIFANIKADYDAFVGSANDVINKTKGNDMDKTIITITTHNGFEIERGCSRVLNEDEINKEFQSLMRIMTSGLEEDDYIENAYAKIDGVVEYETKDDGDGLIRIKEKK